MAELISTVLNAIPFVTSGLTLVAFIAACVTLAHLHSTKAKQDTLRGTNDEKKIAVLQLVLGRLGLSLDKLGKKEAFELAKGELDRMKKQDLHRVIVIIIGMGLLAIIAIFGPIFQPDPVSKNIFQLDSFSGIFCDEKNIQNISTSHFDTIDINFSSCIGSSESSSSSYRIMWPAQNSNPTSTNRNGYSQCFKSDLNERAPQFTAQLQEAASRINDRVPCVVNTTIGRIIFLSYTDLHDQSHMAGFLQSYDRASALQFRMEQVPTTKLPRSDLMQEFDARIIANSTLDDALIAIAVERKIPNIPRHN